MACAINGILRVSVVLDSPCTRLKPNAEQHLKNNDRYEGYCIDVVRELALLCNFTYLLIEAPSNLYGEYSSNGTWTGMIGEVARGSVELGAAQMSTTYERSAVVDFLSPIIFEGKGMLMKKTRQETPNIFSVVAPLTGHVWGLTGLAVLVFSASVWIISIISNPYTEDNPSSIKLSAVDSFWFMLATLLEQGTNIEPQTLSTKALSTAWWFFGLMLVASYTGNLTAFLTVERMNTPINSFDDLVKQSKIRYGAHSNSTIVRFFKNTSLDVYQKIWAHMASNPADMVTNHTEGVERAKAGGYAFIADTTSLSLYLQKSCDLALIEDYSRGLTSAGFIVPKGLPYRDMLSQAIIQMRETEMIAKIYSKWVKRNDSECIEDTDPKSQALDTENLAGIFVILALGLLAAYCIAILERIVRVRCTIAVAVCISLYTSMCRCFR